MPNAERMPKAKWRAVAGSPDPATSPTEGLPVGRGGDLGPATRHGQETSGDRATTAHLAFGLLSAFGLWNSAFRRPLTTHQTHQTVAFPPRVGYKKNQPADRIPPGERKSHVACEPP